MRRDNNVLLTGSKGFLGSVVAQTLSSNGFIVKDLNDLENRRVDISRPISVSSNIGFSSIVHLAGMAHIVPRTEQEKRLFWGVNLEGTKNICKWLDASQSVVSNFVFISSVSVYGLDSGENIDENYPLDGVSDYAKSKIEAERCLLGWAKSRNIRLLILRLPLIVGYNPPGNLGAMIKGIRTGRYFTIGSGSARKSMVLASDVADLITDSIGKEGIYNLTDGSHPSFKELAATIAYQLHKKQPHSLPLGPVKMMAKLGDLIGGRSPINSYRLSKMLTSLTFSDDRARLNLNWNPHRVLDEFWVI